MFRRPLISLSARITVGAVLTVLLIGGASFWILQDYYREQMIDSLAASTTAQGELIEQSLRYAMHARSLDLLTQMVRSLADQNGVEKVMILDKKGVIRFSSEPREKGRQLVISDPTCAICHSTSPSMRGRTVTFETADAGQVFRNVNPILNSSSCFECHSPQDRINGVLIVDYSMAGIESSLRASSRKMWLSALTLALAIAAVIVVFMRRTVLRRLRRLVRVVDSIEAGEVDATTETRDADEIDILSDHIELMTRRLDRSMRQILDREAYLDAVINSADDGIVVVDDHLQVVTPNRAFEQLLGIGRSELIGAPCNCTNVCVASHADDCPARLTLQSGEVTRRIRTITDDDGRVCYYEISASPLRDGTQEPQVIEVWRDITRRREIEAHLAHSERLASLGTLASGISHEINNPLASIVTCLDGLRRRLRADGKEIPPELPEYLELIRKEVDRCRDLTERLMVLGRKPQAQSRPVNLNAVVGETLALLRYEANKRSVEFQENLAGHLQPVQADEAQLRQVILNVVLNAIEAIEGPGWLRVTTRARSAGIAQLDVVDSGRGIKPSDIDRIFEPFYSARRGRQGTGLGLFISKIIIDQLGGTVRVTSRPGKGTQFTVLLPTTGREVLT